MTEDPTQRIVRPAGRTGYAADAPTTAMPGPLNLAGDPEPVGDTSTTDVLSLDELFDTEPVPQPAPPASEQTAPTWTAMPVVSVRSEPMTAPPTAAPRPTSAAQAATPAPGPGVGSRLRSDAAAAWDDTVRRSRAWLGRDDNALMLLTALVAVCLILAVAAFSA